MDADLQQIIEEESLKPDETRAFVANAFRDGAIPESGTAITKMARLTTFLDRYLGLTLCRTEVR